MVRTQALLTIFFAVHGRKSAILCQKCAICRVTLCPPNNLRAHTQILKDYPKENSLTGVYCVESNVRWAGCIYFEGCVALNKSCVTQREL